ncbi:MAG: ATP-binding protein [Gammaproteobacteria bacterium]|nr:MAG: ATP-binding protein [Gammaproteobacteria bacterium]
MTELFPLRVVTGKRFCNREKEKRFLRSCIEQKRPVVLISPRRYGKTSLANKVVEELRYPFCSIDFLTAYDDYSICLNIIKGVSELVSQIMPINMKTIKLIEKCFHGVKAVMRYKVIELEYAAPIEKADPTLQVLETLKGLENLAAKLRKTVVILIDEFQNVLETPKGQAIQGSIRHVAQTAKHIAFMFSGSSRHMLCQAFDDSNLPLYMMCEKLHLDRIDSQHYFSYIQDAAKIKWKKMLPEMIIQRILDLTENHSFYVNYLCGRLWEIENPPGTEEEVDRVWHECFLNEERRFIVELDRLTLNQRLLLKAIANTSDLKEPTAVGFLSKVGLASGTAVPVLKALTNKDMIFVDGQGMTRVLDPLLRYMLVS